MVNRDKLIKLISQADDRVLSVPYIGEDGAEALADYLLENGFGFKIDAYKEFAERLDDVFAEIESKIPTNKIVLKTIQAYKNIIQIVKKELVGDING